ncbi:MAG: T9SS type A sorting domain-containing protein [candidate division KSB1 bacterium]|nr:T9SS type A sorting domain-containing protein [candidate division KSB1 bacterium]MDZ7276590.1 T9SS type A sorting domain-containing protein [candidate division KSB1 bacterium]MDZ7288237.1 T9SS type A sorting domain-containing protein [candidate division KSB1 bacterium]MDZ7300372.1 T9SS type A sorting domain-containing protein [candidate division KSB1 bacterium]MDZ7307810.1 T9SS type A sorting domain-containing protein [candidate division KSB1 bacterium]
MQMRRQLRWCGLLLLLAIWPASAQVLPRLSGHVMVAADSTPVPNFPLLLLREGPGPGPGRYAAITDSAGYYSTLLAPGTYMLSTVDTAFFKPVTIPHIKVDLGQHVIVDVQLVRQDLNAVISGNVSLAGRGVAGVELFLYKINSTTPPYQGQDWDPKAAVYRDTTDDQGNFSVKVVPGSYFIFLRGTDDYLPFWSSPIFVGAGDTANVRIELTPRPLFKTIAGRVSNSGDYKWVVVTAHSLTTGIISADRPAADGSYQLKAPPGKYIVRCDAYLDGTLYTVYYDGVTSPQQATPVDITINDATGIDFRLPPVGALAAFTISGQVVEEGSGAPLAGAFVTFIGYNVHYGDSLASRHVVRTDGNGNYSFTGYTFFDQVPLIGSAYQDGYFLEFYDNQPSFLTATPIVVKAGENLTGINFSLTRIIAQPGYSISGKVQGEDGRPFSCGVVIAYSTAGVKFASTDDTGFYKIEGFPAGTHVILQAWGAPAYLPEFYDNKFSFREADVLVMNGDKSGIDFVLAKRNRQTVLGWLRGMVWLPGRPKAAGQGMGATVYVRKNGSADWFAAAYADADGAFELPIETYGQYEIRVTSMGYNDATRVVEVDESTGLFRSGLEISLVPTGVTEDGNAGVIRSHRLQQAYPNPFKPVTTITVEMARRESATVTIYNVMGQKVATLHHGLLPQGSTRFQWQGRDDAGRAVAPGLYFFRLTTADGMQTRAVVLLQ